ncbi:MAG: type II CRISPR RNA-guided endonuclease Cas9, partial [Rhodobacteraceae bacterium]|nr:type II CRISPR RNA-guided endonuclease Cas9 [Paracoccaceae bacterium]
DQLPYYGAVLERHVIPGSGRLEDDDVTRFGRIINPTVHIGLNQLRRLVNKIISVYGKPDQIVVELARELKQSHKQKKDAQKRIKENTDAARKRSEKLGELGQKDTGANRMLLRLYEELGPAIGPRCCPYTGKPINVSMLFNGLCDVDHILPYSRTLDDSPSNLTLCLREANREKGNQTPWETWGDTPQWNAIAANLKSLPENKRWRFTPDAMERFEGENDFLDRALVDTQYLSRIARAYLDALYTEGGHVWVVPGRLTEMLRRRWGLNSLLPDHDKGKVKAKNRTDHRHHAIDAAVVAATDRSLIKQISDVAKRDAGKGLSAEDVARTMSAPWEGFRSDIGNQL